MALSELGEQDQPTESVVPKKPVLPAWVIVSAMLINNMSPGDIIKGTLNDDGTTTLQNVGPNQQG